MRRLVLVLSALVCAAIVVATATGASDITAPPVAFPDPAGDAGTAADITNIAVTNDDHGQYTFAITFATPYAGNAGFELYFDTDKNPNTGDVDSSGSEFVLVDDFSAHAYGLFFWTGSTWQAVTSAKTAAVSIAADGKSMTLSINKSDLANTTAFNFWLWSLEGDGSTGHYDDAPSGSGTFAYTAQTVFTLSVGVAAQTAAKAGGSWGITMAAVRSDTNATVGSEATLVCKAKAGTKALALTGKAFVSAGSGGGSAAVCAFKVPKTLKGKTLTATMTISENGQTVSHTFTTKAK
jgi:hypothetical protein